MRDIGGVLDSRRWGRSKFRGEPAITGEQIKNRCLSLFSCLFSSYFLLFSSGCFLGWFLV
jgi:hypothetical protein